VCVCVSVCVCVCVCVCVVYCSTSSDRRERACHKAGLRRMTMPGPETEFLLFVTWGVPLCSLTRTMSCLLGSFKRSTAFHSHLLFRTAIINKYIFWQLQLAGVIRTFQQGTPMAGVESQKETFRKYLESAGAIDVLVKGGNLQPAFASSTAGPTLKMLHDVNTCTQCSSPCTRSRRSPRPR